MEKRLVDTQGNAAPLSRHHPLPGALPQLPRVHNARHLEVKGWRGERGRIRNCRQCL